MPIGCVLFLFYYLCSEFLEIILKEMRGLAIIFRFFMLLVLLLPVVALCPVKAETTSEGPILIVTSYNPETRSISDNLSAFMTPASASGDNRPVRSLRTGRAGSTPGLWR